MIDERSQARSDIVSRSTCLIPNVGPFRIRTAQLVKPNDDLLSISFSPPTMFLIVEYNDSTMTIDLPSLFRSMSYSLSRAMRVNVYKKEEEKIIRTAVISNEHLYKRKSNP